ncbi:replication initiation protein [Pseudoalteromonas sp. Hal099]
MENKVRALTEAIKYRYIQPNNFNSKSWLVYDIDRATSPDEIRNDRLVPPPTIFVQNPKNGHAHLFYLLKTPVHANIHSSQKALRFAAAVDVGLALKLGADMSYGGLLAKNALHNDWRVLQTHSEAYELNYLSEFVDTSMITRDAANDAPMYGLHRNYTLFEQLRNWAYKAIRQGYPKQLNDWEQAVLQRGIGLNILLKKDGIQQLPEKEIKSISRSVAKWTHRHFSATGFSEWQSIQGAKGGKKSRGGGRPSLGNPWIELGISRATYFRKKKLNEI